MLKNAAVAAPAGDPLHLRVAAGANDHRKPAFPLCPCHNVVDPFDEGAGSIDDFCPGGFQPLQDIFCHTVGADDHGHIPIGLLRRGDHTNAQTFKALHHMAVVDDRAQCYNISALHSSLLHRFHRTVDTKAKSGAFGYSDTHKPHFSCTIPRIAATTPSISKSEVSTKTASLACFSGAISRWESW